jgi:hypothetical protein
MDGSPGFTIRLVGVRELHAAFLNESRTRGTVWILVQEIRVSLASKKTSEETAGRPLAERKTNATSPPLGGVSECLRGRSSDLQAAYLPGFPA